MVESTQTRFWKVNVLNVRQLRLWDFSVSSKLFSYKMAQKLLASKQGSEERSYEPERKKHSQQRRSRTPETLEKPKISFLFEYCYEYWFQSWVWVILPCEKLVWNIWSIYLTPLKSDKCVPKKPRSSCPLTLVAAFTQEGVLFRWKYRQCEYQVKS